MGKADGEAEGSQEGTGAAGVDAEAAGGRKKSAGVVETRRAAGVSRAGVRAGEAEVGTRGREAARESQ